MTRLAMAAIAWGLCALTLPGTAAAQSTTAPAVACTAKAAAGLPKRQRRAHSASALLADIGAAAGTARDRLVAEQVLAGNVPDFLRRFVPVTLRGTAQGHGTVEVTICVTPDYLAVGGDEDFVRVPLGLPAAAAIADGLGYLLPTTRMVDAIHAQAGVRLSPDPMPPTAAMSSTAYFWRHNETVETQRRRAGRAHDVLTAGQKKDIVLTNRLRAKPGRVAIYGWHRPDGRPIQPLSTVHHAEYADYSHGVRLVSPVAFVNGTPRGLAAILQDPQLAPIVSAEGTIPQPEGLLASLH